MTMTKEEKFQKDWLISQITPRGNGKAIKTNCPKDGIAAYVWRMCRFELGHDMTYPITCFFKLANQVEKDGIVKHFKCGVFGPEEKAILDKLDAIVKEICKDLSSTATRQSWERFYFNTMR